MKFTHSVCGFLRNSVFVYFYSALWREEFDVCANHMQLIMLQERVICMQGLRLAGLVNRFTI